ncbi:hypothetical protein F9C07_2260927 [Aspergillus flavus]|uniref:Uncharacterized protein n=1 Tax=Aspergillus flavus (strain ATCC 200026 / FGSC A1120 / IAM 13836 / NRRL 3357 / JCM 12722 / SRRC 167) TaxID=332952 RepID=A0A7U2R2R9_ASPFN|nr:hypothetical protein F9C07_2260927 [Aspergillus flavus]
MQIEASENTQSTTDMLKLLWNLAPHVEAFPEMFINVADRHYLESPELESMFARVKDAKKCQEFLNAMMLTMSLDKRSGYIAILDLMLESNFEIETFLEHKVDIKLSQEMVNKALELQDYDALKVLIKYGSPQELNLQDAVAAIDNSPPY